MDHVLRQVRDNATRLSLLGNYLESVRSTVFRQTQLAEFELAMHEMAERGEPITGEAVANRYLEIARKFYGHDQNVCVVDDVIAHEWSYIPHFYSSFYVFQYATSFTAAEALAAKVLSGDGEARRRYLAFLSAGTSKYPIELLKDAGVDMTTDEALELTMQKMHRVMDEIEKVL
jgi:oligoendopeptidase F